METFTNSVILPENLPVTDAQTFNKLDGKYLKIILIRLAFFSVSLAGGIFALFFFAEKNLPFFVVVISILSVVLLIAYLLVISVLGFPKKGYLLREKDISYKRGLIAYKQTSVPFNRIQHVEVNQGVLAKIFQLASVKIYTAGGTSSDLTIPGVPVETAGNLKAFLSEKISEHE
jgi:membrane protein YdbS with pleckstrin-like domain